MIIYNKIRDLFVIALLLVLGVNHTYSNDSILGITQLGWTVEDEFNRAMGTILITNISNDSIEITGFRYSGKTDIRCLTDYHVVLPPAKSLPIRWDSRYIEFLYRDDFESFCQAYQKGRFKIDFRVNTIINDARQSVSLSFIPLLEELRFAPTNTSCLSFEPEKTFLEPTTEYSLMNDFIYLEDNRIRVITGVIRLENLGNSNFQLKKVTKNVDNFFIHVHSNSFVRENDQEVHSQVQKGQSILLIYSLTFPDKRLEVEKFLKKFEKITVELEYVGGFTELIDITFSKDRLIKIIH